MIVKQLASRCANRYMARSHARKTATGLVPLSFGIYVRRMSLIESLTGTRRHDS